MFSDWKDIHLTSQIINVPQAETKLSVQSKICPRVIFGVSLPLVRNPDIGITASLAPSKNLYLLHFTRYCILHDICWQRRGRIQGRGRNGSEPDVDAAEFFYRTW